jgi:hypothetical protein
MLTICWSDVCKINAKAKFEANASIWFASQTSSNIISIKTFTKFEVNSSIQFASQTSSTHNFNQNIYDKYWSLALDVYDVIYYLSHLNFAIIRLKYQTFNTNWTLLLMLYEDNKLP